MTIGVCIAVAFLAACSPGKSTDAGSASDSAPSADLSIYLDQAFKTAFGASGQAAHDIPRQGQPVAMTFAPKDLIDIGGGRLALISASLPAGDDCDDKCGRAVAVHYLRKAADGSFQVTGQWWDLLPAGPLDGASEARIREDLFAAPAVQIEVPHRDRGCQSSSAALFELAPSGPVLRARDISTARTNIPMGALRLGAQVDYYGNILPDVKGQRFKVHYHGSTEGDAVYGPGAAAGVWAQTAQFNLPEC